MRKLLTGLCLLAAALASGGGHPVPAPQPPLLASAERAAVAAPQSPEIIDHYGDPECFIRYIIRRPPVFA